MALTRDKIIIEASAEVKKNDLGGLSSSLDDVDSSSESFKKTIIDLERQAASYIEALERQGVNLLELEKKAKIAAKANEQLASSSVSAAASLSEINKASAAGRAGSQGQLRLVNAISSSYHRLAENISNTISILDTLTNPETLKKLSIFVKFLSTILKFKGFSQLSSIASESATRIDQLRESVESAGDLSFDSLVEKAEKFNQVVEAAGNTVLALGAGASAAVGVITVNSFRNAVVASENVSKSLTGANSSLSQTALIASNLGPGFKKTAEDAAGLGSKFTGLASSAAGRLRPSVIGVAEAGVFLAPVLALIGQRASESEQRFVKFAGILATVAAVALVGFTAGLNLVLTKLGELSSALGGSLLAKMKAWESSFQSAESVMSQFRFTAQAFENASNGATGSFEKWNRIMIDLESSTTQTQTAIAKSAKLLIADGYALGIQFDDLSTIINRAVPKPT